MIKTLLCVVFAAVSMTFSAQKYEFNYLLEYSGVSAKHLYFINSKDCSYQLSLYNSSTQKAILRDYRNDIFHYYSYSAVGEKGALIFRYVASEKSKMQNNDREYAKIETFEKDQYLLSSFRNKKARKPRMTVSVKMKPFEENVILFRADSYQNMAFCNLLQKELPQDTGYIIEEYQEKYYTDHQHTDRLTGYEKVQLILEIPSSKLVLKDWAEINALFENTAK